nr:hypothetical protein [Delftia acidovorans]
MGVLAGFGGPGLAGVAGACVPDGRRRAAAGAQWRGSLRWQRRRSARSPAAALPRAVSARPRPGCIPGAGCGFRGCCSRCSSRVRWPCSRKPSRTG